MPANLTAQYFKAEEAFKAAKTTEDKIAALEHMISVLPKHKGTDHMLADLRHKLSKLREAGEQEARSKKAAFDPYRVEKQGAGQVVLLGAPNSGKSALVGALTRAQVNVTPYPFSTAVPVPGMLQFEDVKIQLVDTPSVQSGNLPPGMLGLVKSADAVLVVADVASPEVLDEIETLTAALEEGRARLHSHSDPPQPEALVRDIPALVVANKTDVDGAEEVIEILDEALENQFEILALSATSGVGLDDLRAAAFKLLDRIRVYTKEPGKSPDRAAPFVLDRDDTVVELARRIHRDFPNKLKQARIWGSARFDGQAVAKDYRLEDGDIIELHIDG